MDFGDEVDHVLTVTNNGTCDLTQVVVVEDIPTITVDEPEVPAFTVIAPAPVPAGGGDGSEGSNGKPETGGGIGGRRRGCGLRSAA